VLYALFTVHWHYSLLLITLHSQVKAVTCEYHNLFSVIFLHVIGFLTKGTRFQYNTLSSSAFMY